MSLDELNRNVGRALPISMTKTKTKRKQSFEEISSGHIALENPTLDARVAKRKAKKKEKLRLQSEAKALTRVPSNVDGCRVPVVPAARGHIALENPTLDARVAKRKAKKKEKLRLQSEAKALTRVPSNVDVKEEEVNGESKVEGGGRKRKRKAKHKKGLESSEEEEEEEKQYGLQRGSHGYGIQPLGNLLLSTSGCNVRDVGLGALQVLSDETIYDILSNLNGRDLARLSLVSKALYVFAHQDSLWRNLVLENYQGKLGFQGCWKTTYLTSLVPNYDGSSPHIPLKVKDFYSDYLFQSWLCASLEIKPDWLSTDNIDRRENLSVEDFIKEYEEPNKPVLLLGVLDSWPATAKWDREYLVKHAGEVDFAAGPIHLKLSDYYQYADAVEEERPLYIFDSKFGEKAPQLAADYQVPVYFREDLFSILGEERPDYRWLIAGPARSGSSFHIDPNSTSAWNAVVRGAKKWVMYPPEVVPPGVYPSPDGADVATSVSITEWFMNFYGETKQRGGGSQRPVECICRAGEVVFVPRGWWHVVINLEESIAITQNFVSRSNILNVLEFLSRPNSQHLVSGTRDRVNLYEKFRSRYESLYPGSIEAIKQKAEQREAELQKTKTSIWYTATDVMTGGFKFGF